MRVLVTGGAGFIADITHPNQVLGFRPKVTFTEGIRIFTDWYLSRKGAGHE